MTLRIIYEDANAGKMGTCIRSYEIDIGNDNRYEFERDILFTIGLGLDNGATIAPGAIKKVLVVEDDPRAAPRVSENSHV